MCLSQVRDGAKLRAAFPTVCRVIEEVERRVAVAEQSEFRCIAK